MKPDAPSLGESKAQATRQFYSNERSLAAKGKWDQFQDIVKEYIDLGHTEPVPTNDLSKPASAIFYMPMHDVVKASSTTTKFRVVFDASTKISSTYSFNDLLLTGPTLYPPLEDILLRFWTFPVAISGDIAKMYRAVQLAPQERDFYRFIWRQDQDSPLTDYRMTRVTFGVASSPFVTIQALQRTSEEYDHLCPLSKEHVTQPFT